MDLFPRRVPTRWLVVGFIAAAGVAALLLRGRWSAPDDRRQLALRLIAEETQEVFDGRRLAERVTVFDWNFRDERDRRRWGLSGLDPARAVGADGLHVGFPSRDSKAVPRLVRALGMDAHLVDAIEVTVAGPRRDFRHRGTLQLYWSGRAQEFDEQRSLRIPAVNDIGDYRTTYVFPVFGHPLWKGMVDRVRLDPVSAPGEAVDVRSLRGVKYRLAAEGLEAALTRPWKLALGGDLRGCLLAVPGRPLEREVVVPAAGSAFRFAYGIPYGVGAPVRFRVGVEARERARVNAFDEVVRPGRPGQVDAWHEGTIDLSPFAGERVRLVLETSSRGSLDPLRGLPAWANPEVWSEASAPLPPNLILISLDTLRADRLSLYGYPRPTSPNIDAWARRRAAVFLDAVAPSPWTLPSHVSLFTGLDALRHGVNQVDPVPRSLKMMAQWLRAAGYATVAVTGGAYLSAGYGFDRGFDSFAAWPAAPGTDPPEVEVGIDRSLRWLRALADRPFFLFFHTYEIHEPYQPRQPFYSQLSPGSPEAPEGRSSPVPPTARDGFAVRRRALLGATPVADADLPVLDRLYDAGVAFTDAQLGRLLRELQALGLEGRTAVVITSDHGEALGERGLGGHAYLYDFNLSIPLIVSLPDGRGRGRRIPNQVRLVDVLPTLLELAGIAPGSGGDGASLLPLIEEPSRAAPRDAWSYASSSNYGIALRTPNRVKYIFNNTAWSPACGREELFDLVTDPREENDAAPGSGLVAELRRRVDRRLKEWSNGISVRFSNRTSSSYAGSLQAPFLHQITVKADGQSCPDVSWNERAGHVDYVVRPGQSFGVVLEDAGSEALKITAAFSAAGSGFERSLDPRDLGRPWQIRSDGGGWRDGPAGAVPPDTGIVVRWLGDPQRREGRARERDAATDEQLRALGYVQ